MVRYDSLVRHVAGDSLAALYAPEGEMLGTNQGVIRGQDSIRAFLGTFTNIHVDTATMHSDAISLLGDEAVQWGTYRQAATVGSQPMIHVQGRFVANWIRGSDGRWLLRRMFTQPAPLP